MPNKAPVSIQSTDWVAAKMITSTAGDFDVGDTIPKTVPRHAMVHWRDAGLIQPKTAPKPPVKTEK